VTSLVPDAPQVPEGWQYGVVMDDGLVWGCGTGEEGFRRARMRLRYRNVVMPCMLPAKWPTSDTAPLSRDQT
jgi:hypothetical protein